MANITAIELARSLHAEGRQPTADEQQQLARWSSWGALSQVFDETNSEWREERQQLRSLLDDDAWDAAKLTTINAHYTSPEITRAMWSALQQLGFEQGRVLEPGCGVGTFIGTAPEQADMVGVELDATTATIAGALYPEAEIRRESFADSRLVDASFDAAIGNVPFADVRLHDPAHNPGRRNSMHNHFIIKSLALTKPGGVVAVLTSRYTLDSLNPGARRDMYDLGDLIGAVRLPTGAHRRTAGTEAVTDLLLLRRRKAEETPQPFTWETSTPTTLDLDADPQPINDYFLEHPEHVLGTLRISHGMYGSATLNVDAADLATVPDQLEETLAGIVDTAGRQQLLHDPVDAPHVEVTPLTIPDLDVEELWDGTLIDRDGSFYRVSGGAVEPLQVPRTQVAELRSLLSLRDQAMALLDAESRTRGDDPHIEEMRAGLNDTYQQHVTQFGLLNRYTEQRTGRTEPVLDETTGEPVLDDVTGEPMVRDITRRASPRVMSTLRSDPNSHLVTALEVWDDSAQTGSPAALLRERQLADRPIVRGAETPAEALAITLDQVGRVDVDHVADLLGMDQETARDALGTLIYDDPELERPVTAAEYLSGNVRTKLEAAVTAARTDERFEVNVAALQEVLPAPILAEEITARLGSVWISPEIHEQFVRELLRDQNARVENPLPGEWVVKGSRRTALASQEWGTPERSAIELLQSAMNQSPVKVFEAEPDGTRTFDPVATQAANDKISAISDRFEEWAWEAPERAAELAAEYNRRFNSIVLRDYTTEGRALRLPGLAERYVPDEDHTKGLRDHQRAAVARMINEPSVGLFHQVGAGKTLEMVVGATELRRLGLIKKPLVVVPNHMLEQFSREWLQAYPQARLLVGSTDDVTKSKKADFIARAATHDWDAIIMSQSSFKNVNVAPEIKADYMKRQVAEIGAHLQAAQEANSTTVKRIEKAKLKLEEKIKDLLDIERTPGLYFEDMGVDYLVVDEAHTFKNLATVSSIPGAAIEGSQQASDMHMKLEWLRATQGDRVVTMATATPIANSITETHVMQRYLRPDLLRDAGVEHFDSWAATFAASTSEMEISPAGKFRMKTRFARYVNTPEFLRMWGVFADVKTAEDLNLPTPEIAQRPSDGRRAPHTLVVEPTPEFLAYSDDIQARADQLAKGSVDPTEDNMLKLSSDARKAALDMRMIDPTIEPSGPGKLAAVADTIHRHWQESKDNVYRGRDGQPSPTRGALQLVFLDLGTPTNDPDRFDAYNHLRDLLTDRGMDPTTIRFIHEAKNDKEKDAIFTAARSGEIAVLIGSTQKMGVGTNVQDRIVALHHVDCPWRPADVEQRDGRGVRQGNQNPEIAIYRYVTEGSFDAYTWQTLERKARFINQVMKGRVDAREVEDVGDQSMSASEAKALASGEPLLLEKADADHELTRLRRQHSAHLRSQQNLRFEHQHYTNKIAHLEDALQQLEAAEPRTRDISGDKFHMTIGNHRFTKRAEAVDGLRAWARAARSQLEYGTTADAPMVMGAIGGHTITAHTEIRFLGGARERMVQLNLQDVPETHYEMKLASLLDSDIGVIRALEHRSASIPGTIGKLNTQLLEAKDQLTHIENNVGKPFKNADELAAAEQRVKKIDERLSATQKSKQNTHDQPHLNPNAVSSAAIPGGPGGEQPPPQYPNPRNAARPDPHHTQPVTSTPARVQTTPPATERPRWNNGIER